MIAEINPALSVTVVVLAAGKSSRTGSSGIHKLLAEFQGMPLVRRSTLVASGCESRSVVVVTGHRHPEIQDAIADLKVQVVYNKYYLSGMASSLGLGVATAESDQPDGILIMLADMPVLTARDLNSLIAAFRTSEGKCVVRAVAQGVPGNPVIFPRALYDQLKDLAGDVGARGVIQRCGLPVIDVEIGDGARIDVDTPDQVVAAGGILRK